MFILGLCHGFASDLISSHVIMIIDLDIAGETHVKPDEL